MSSPLPLRGGGGPCSASEISRVGAGRLNPPDGAGCSRGGGGAFSGGEISRDGAGICRGGGGGFRWQNFGWLVKLSRVVAGVSLVACVGGALAGGGALEDAPRVGAEMVPLIDDMLSKYSKSTERHENTY